MASLPAWKITRWHRRFAVAALLAGLMAGQKAPSQPIFVEPAGIVTRRSTKEEILRVRLNRARQLLAETDFSLALVAEKIGLEHAEYLNVIFKKKTGLTPGQFRNQAGA